MTVLYIITRYITFFGAVLRVFWEQLACRICKIPIEDTRVFKQDELCGHLEHELPGSLKQAFVVCWLPFTMNFFIGCAFLLTGAYRLFYIMQTNSPMAYGLVWLGVSCLANCAPSFENMLSLKDFLYGGSSKALRVVLSPFFGVVCAGAYLEKFSITFLLTILFAIVFPYIFNLLFPVLDYIDQALHQ